LRVYYGLDFSLWQVEQAEVSNTFPHGFTRPNGRDTQENHPITKEILRKWMTKDFHI
jgi:hypothetical protein